MSKVLTAILCQRFCFNLLVFTHLFRTWVETSDVKVSLSQTEVEHLHQHQKDKLWKHFFLWQTLMLSIMSCCHTVTYQKAPENTEWKKVEVSGMCRAAKPIDWFLVACHTHICYHSGCYKHHGVHMGQETNAFFKNIREQKCHHRCGPAIKCWDV